VRTGSVEPLTTSVLMRIPDSSRTSGHVRFVPNSGLTVVLHTSSECTRASASRIACHSTCTLLDFAGSLERFEILSLNGSDCLNCFHSSASASQYSISEYSISFLASAACSRHIASNALNCFFEYMGFPVATQFMPLLNQLPTDDVVTRLDTSASTFPNESWVGNLLSRLKKVLMVTERLFLI
jgi:hypothetical protein